MGVSNHRKRAAPFLRNGLSPWNATLLLLGLIGLAFVAYTNSRKAPNIDFSEVRREQGVAKCKKQFGNPPTSGGYSIAGISYYNDYTHMFGWSARGCQADLSGEMVVVYWVPIPDLSDERLLLSLHRANGDTWIGPSTDQSIRRWKRAIAANRFGLGMDLPITLVSIYIIIASLFSMRRKK